MSSQHFICFRDIPLLYGRVPKVANSSIKAALYKLLKTQKSEGVRTTSDSFWRTGTHGETSMLSAHDARMRRGSHFCFSFVRNPFDRLVSAYNNKLIELPEVPGPMKSMGLTHAMSFGSFLEIVASTSDDELDIHLLPQSKILCLDGQLIPDFIGRFEEMNEDWNKLNNILKREGLPNLGMLPRKNIRRTSDKRDTACYFEDRGFVHTATQRYRDDFERFYTNRAAEELFRGY